MPVCAVPGCEKKRALTYRVPFEDRELCQKWLSAIRNQNQDQQPAVELLKTLRVCSHHFTPDSFRPNLKLQLVGIKAKPELKDDAVPSLFPWTYTAEPEPPFQKARSEECSPGKKYTKEDLACALNELETGGSLRRVGIKYGIPHTTLRDYKKKRYAHNPHPNRALTPEEEKALVKYILWRSEHGFPVTRAVVRTLALNIIKSSQRSTLVNLDKGLSAMWWSRFRARHPELNSRTPAALDQMEVQERPPQSAEGLLNICEPLYEKHGLREKPHLIFSCGELGFGEKDLSRRGPEPVRGQQNLERITVHCCVSASGGSIPPFIIYPRCLPSTAYALEGPPSALYALSAKGYMNAILFLDWLIHFIKHAPAERPLLLFLDQHESHVSKEVVDVCRGSSIEVVCLPAPSTLPLQPLVASVFGSLRAAFVSEASRIGLVNGGVVLRRHFSAVLKHAYDQAVTPDTVQEGFRRTGLYPLSRTVLTLTSSDPLEPSSISGDQTLLPSSPSGSDTANQRSQTSESYHSRREEEEVNSTSPLSDSSDVEEISWSEDAQDLQMYQGSNIFRSSEVMVNTQCLMELFRFCSVCLVECSVSVEGHERLFSVTQACQSCGYHREWSNHPTSTEQPEHGEEVELMENTDHEEVEEVQEEVMEPE